MSSSISAPPAPVSSAPVSPTLVADAPVADTMASTSTPLMSTMALGGRGDGVSTNHKTGRQGYGRSYLGKDAISSCIIANIGHDDLLINLSYCE